MKKILARYLRPGWIVVYLIAFWMLIRWFAGGNVELHQTVRLSQGETVSKVYEHLGRYDRLQLKRFFRTHAEELASIQPGAYAFSGEYSFDEILEIFLAGPQVVYEHITVLEGWSSYDIDATLTENELITAGAYRAFITDPTILARYTQRFPFLEKAQEERGSLTSLEGYLYPDTYYVDLSKDVIDQLVFLQLQNFQTKVRDTMGTEISTLSERLNSLGYEFSLSTYGAIILASIIEKEERASSQRPAVAGVFYNRLQDNMRLDADISLCYGLAQPYSACTPQVIVEQLSDNKNLYNTRAVGGLPPTPIGNPTSNSIESLLKATKGPYYYYLHDGEGTLHLAASISEHNNNKSKYLNY